MDYKSSLVPIMGDVVEMAMQAAGKTDPNEINAMKDKVADVLNNNQGVATKIDALVKVEPKIPGSEPLVSKPKPPPAEPETFDRFRSFVRPAITIMLALTFVFLIVAPFFIELKNWDKIFSAFMGVFGTIIGFWFGERSALKVPGGEEAKEVAAKVKDDAAKAKEDSAKALETALKK
jgi:hypothetical protein